MVTDLDQMIEQLGELVNVETPSTDIEACQRGADVIAKIGSGIIGRPPERLDVDGRPHVRWGGDDPSVLLVGHFDTVWPLGTIDRLPFAVKDGVATGPGCFDMKSGIVMAFHVLAGAGEDVGLLLTSDEEIGSQTSRALIERTAAGARAALVMEPAGDGGALKIGRKGVGSYGVWFTGRAAHAGLEPEKGRSALLALAEVVPLIAALTEADAGTTVTPSLANAGSAVNVVPANAYLEIDVRTTSADEETRVREAITGLATTVEDVGLAVKELTGRPPFAEALSAELFATALEAATAVGLGAPTGLTVGGGSDGNFTAAIGVPTLDGLGGVGGGAHAEDEHVLVASMPERVALVSELVRRLAG